MAHQCSCLIKLTRFGLGIVFVLIGLCAPAGALTFKSDGSVVQKSGKVENKSFADRFSSEMSRPTKNWAKSTGSPRKFTGYFGDDVLVPGAPLLRIQGIKKGEEYLDAVFRLNGLADKKALYRYIIANASPGFIEEMGLSEEDAQSYLDTAISEMLAGKKVKNTELASSGVNSGILRLDKLEIEDVLADQIAETIDDQLEEAVSDAVEAAVEAAIDNWLDELIEYYNINPEAISRIGDGWVIVDCSKQNAEQVVQPCEMLEHGHDRVYQRLVIPHPRGLSECCAGGHLLHRQSHTDLQSAFQEQFCRLLPRTGTTFF